LKNVVAHPPARAGITLFKSNGLAVEDVAAAGFIYERGLEAGIGRSMAPLYS
jgi:ornithine cyclodeaminase/alanine dehydrogenase-like protein (mu-crystallin family)